MILLPLLLATLAGAADVDRYPLQAAVELPETGVVRIHVPLGLRTPEDPADATDLLLVDGKGAVVPVVRLKSQDEYEALDVRVTRRATPTTDPDAWSIDAGDRPVDALTVRLPAAPAAATVTVEAPVRGDWQAVSDPVLVWRTTGAEQAVVPLDEARSGDLRVRLRWHTPPPTAEPMLGTLRYLAPRVPREEAEVEVTDWRLQENGFARYDVLLPAAWPASQIVLHPTDPLFERRAGAVAAPTPASPEERLWWDPEPGYETIQRIRLGGADVDRTTVMAPSPPTDQFAVLVESSDRPPLDLPDVTVVVPGVHLVAQDAGPGPHVLYGGASPESSPTFDLGAAASELARLAAEVVEPADIAPNPAYVPPEVRAALAGPSTRLDLSDQKWSHPVTGPTGLARIPLPPEVLADARPDLGDLRLATADGRQIPYVLRRRGADHEQGPLAFTRTERGSQSILEVPLPVPDVPVSSVAITTSAPVFSRRVTVARPRAARLDTLRAYEWVGEARPGRLELEVGALVGDTLVVTIENGDDPPLPVDAIEAAWPAWELWASLPAEGARLVYGHVEATRPRYDLALLDDQIGRRATAVAQVGPREGLKRPPTSLVDKALLAVGIGILALGLLILTIRLLIATPAPQPEAEPEPAES